MKIVTSRANELSRAVDVVDRDVINQIEITQQSPFPIPDIPAPPEVWGVGSGQTANSTFGVSKADSLSNSAETAFSIIMINRGLWRISLSGCYWPGTVGLGNGLRITLRSPQLAEVPLIWIRPDASARTLFFDRDISVLLPSNGWEIRAILGTAGAAETHFYSVGIIGNKFL